MIVAACFLPHPPLLLKEYASAADPAGELRSTCREALTRFANLEPARIVVLAGGRWEGPTGSGADTRRPLGLRVAQELLDTADLPPARDLLVPFDASPCDVAAVAGELAALGAGDDRVGVLVMGDGSARRGERAPGHLDERAFAVDDRITLALADGDPVGLSGIPDQLAADLMMAGRAAWAVLAACVPGRPRVEYAWSGDPFGVLYHVALWSWADG